MAATAARARAVASARVAAVAITSPARAGWFSTSPTSAPGRMRISQSAISGRAATASTPSTDTTRPGPGKRKRWDTPAARLGTSSDGSTGRSRATRMAAPIRSTPEESGMWWEQK